jgi:hypothetical protein
MTVWLNRCYSSRLPLNGSGLISVAAGRGASKFVEAVDNSLCACNRKDGSGRE